MKFLSKNKDSKILLEGMVYKPNQTDNNRALKEALMTEQFNFCAYSEKYFSSEDSIEVEHFDAKKKKEGDNYYNYFAALRVINQHKNSMDASKRFENSTFFKSLFFHNKAEFNKRIKFVDGVYEEINSEDVGAKELIEYLGFNAYFTSTNRSKNMKRLATIFEDANYSTDEQKLSYFRKYPTELSYITAIEIEFKLDLSEFYN